MGNLPGVKLVSSVSFIDVHIAEDHNPVAFLQTEFMPLTRRWSWLKNSGRRIRRDL